MTKRTEKPTWKQAPVQRLSDPARLLAGAYLTRAGTTYRLVRDHLGSVRLVVDVSSGAILQRLDYDEFGRILVDTNPGFQPFGFAGGLYDPDTGLTRFGARDYDPETGRWTAKDPALFGGGQANLYLYVDGEPVNRVDPFGLDWVDSDLWSGIVDFSAGLGDALLLSFGDDIRDLLGIDEVADACSKAYGAGALASLAVGAGRVAYAGVAKGISIFAKSGAAASAGRAQLKRVFRLGAAKNWRPPKLGGKSDAALRASAGKTNLGVNLYGGAIAAAGALGARACGCE
jgi:RHS repeat-associated protein